MMNFVLQTPSLQHLAEVKIVTHLWSQRDIIARLEFKLIKDLHEDQPDITDVMESKVSALPLPEQCKKQLVNLIKPLALEIINWCEYHDEQPESIRVADILLPNQLRWTMHGTVDYQKTAEIMVKDERLDVQRRFELACIYCLRVEACELFKRLIKIRQSYYVPVLRYAKRYDLSQLVRLFARSIDLDADNAMMYPGESSTDWRLPAFKNTLCSGNRGMCEYLFRTFNQREKEHVFDECGTRISSCTQYPNCSLLWYLSFMNEEQQKRMFRDCTENLLECLLRWPTQSLFMEAAKRGWKFMNKYGCNKALGIIVKPIIDGRNDYDYLQLFRECLLLSPADYQQFHSRHSGVLSNSWITKRVEFFKLILEEAPLPLIEAFCDLCYGAVLNERVISDATLMECKTTASLNSENNELDLGLIFRSKFVKRLVKHVMACRTKRREDMARRNRLVIGSK